MSDEEQSLEYTIGYKNDLLAGRKGRDQNYGGKAVGFDSPEINRSFYTQLFFSRKEAQHIVENPLFKRIREDLYRCYEKLAKKANGEAEERGENPVGYDSMFSDASEVKEHRMSLGWIVMQMDALQAYAEGRMLMKQADTYDEPKPVMERIGLNKWLFFEDGREIARINEEMRVRSGLGKSPYKLCSNDFTKHIISARLQWAKREATPETADDLMALSVILGLPRDSTRNL